MANGDILPLLPPHDIKEAVKFLYFYIRRKLGLLTTKYQLSCSDLTSDLEVNDEAAYFHTQAELEQLTEARCSLLGASVSGAVVVDMVIGIDSILEQLIIIPEGKFSSLDSELQPRFKAPLALPNDTRIIIRIVEPGSQARGLIASVRGVEK